LLMSSGSASAHVHAMHASCALLVSSRIVCRCIDHQAFACLCMRGRDENSWQSRPRHTRARNKVLLSAALVVPSAQPPKSECERAARRLPSKRRRRPTFFAIVLPSSSNMTLARSAAVVPRGGSRQVLDLRQRASVWIATSFRPSPRIQTPGQHVFCRAHVPGQRADDYRRATAVIVCNVTQR
jgi:hypothetical protein